MSTLMIESQLDGAFLNNEKFVIVSIDKLELLKNEIGAFSKTEELNGFQKWIVNDLYNFALPSVPFSIQSILLIAIPHPIYTRLTFVHHHRKYTCLSLVLSDFDKNKEIVTEVFNRAKYNLVEARNLPLKRLAVQSGLAIYGRNNICYIDDIGSCFSLIAYFSDIPCGNSPWRIVERAATCDHCTVCLQTCPTGAIRKDRFLIDNAICLSALNESGEPFPDWLPQSVHHTIYDCLRCQTACPMNQAQVKNIGNPIEFSEAETNLLLSGAHFEDYPEPMKIKAKYLGLHQWPEGIAKNLKVLIEMVKQ